MLHDIIKKYMKEVSDNDFHSSGNGFAIYKIVGEEFFIDSFGTAENASKKDTGDFFREVIELAKNSGCKYVTGIVHTHKPKVTERILAHIRRGYKINGTSGDYITLVKEI